SNTTSTPRSFQGSCAGSRIESTLNVSPSTEMPSPLASTFELRLPSTESCLSRCASVAALVRSLTATKSIFLSPSAARMMFRPIRPKPLIPTRTAIKSPPDKRFILQYPPRVHALQPAVGARLCGRVAVFHLPGDPLPEVHRQPAPAARFSADHVQYRSRGIDLDPR